MAFDPVGKNRTQLIEEIRRLESANAVLTTEKVNLTSANTALTAANTQHVLDKAVLSGEVSRLEGEAVTLNITVAALTETLEAERVVAAQDAAVVTGFEEFLNALVARGLISTLVEEEV